MRDEELGKDVEEESRDENERETRKSSTGEIEEIEEHS